MITCHHG
jgi:hypothetical protein